MNLIKKSEKGYKIWKSYYSKKNADLAIIEYNLIIGRLWIN